MDIPDSLQRWEESLLKSEGLAKELCPGERESVKEVWPRTHIFNLTLRFPTSDLLRVVSLLRRRYQTQSPLSNAFVCHAEMKTKQTGIKTIRRNSLNDTTF